MIFRLARKDFLTNLVSARFIIGFLLCLVLIPFSILINVSHYSDRVAQFRLDRDAADKSTREVRVYSTLRPEIVLPPQPLSVFSTGISDQVGSRVKIRLGDKPVLAAGKTEAPGRPFGPPSGPESDNPFLASFFSVDFADIAAIVFSLLALIFSYDALTREREEGTLRLQMSNMIGRSTLLAGKILGIMVTLLPVLCFSFLLSVLLILFSRSVSFTAAEWGRIALLFGLSLVYLAVFVFIGILVSLRSKNSVTSLVLCLFLWVLFVFLVPNASANFAESFVGTPSRDNLDRVLADLDRELGEATSQALKAQGIKEGYSCWWCYGDPDGYFETYGNDRTEFENMRRQAEIATPLLIRYADRRWAVEKAYLDGLDRQARAAERLSLLSPAGVFRVLAAAVCGTDLGSHEAVMDRTRRYRETFLRFLEAKRVFGSYAWITPASPAAFRTADELVEMRTGGEFKTEKAFDDWARKQPDFYTAFRKLQKVKLHGDGPEDYPFLDIADMPRFPEEPLRLFTGLEGSILYGGLLLVEIVVLFYAGYVAFLRFDVR